MGLAIKNHSPGNDQQQLTSLEISESKIWSSVLWHAEPSMTVLVRTSDNPAVSQKHLQVDKSTYTIPRVMLQKHMVTSPASIITRNNCAAVVSVTGMFVLHLTRAFC